MKYCEKETRNISNFLLFVVVVIVVVSELFQYKNGKITINLPFAHVSVCHFLWAYYRFFLLHGVPPIE